MERLIVPEVLQVKKNLTETVCERASYVGTPLEDAVASLPQNIHRKHGREILPTNQAST